ncbi:MAG: alpha/beta fold hydrolase [Candidatus Thioglobus sp.]|jgi:pimeloyl-[acyl-carrier protein] methyl ester esterase|uniref:alpha/beta fold hydrolase n=1 Tax=Candidatus Thioglobus sp. TaxID=2026721 RepID=UPI0001BD36C2|nr:alpha/beta fold hydrolase [Candidatus Thioglobus sp.]EEZ80322.1 MAG: hydrolase [uncultured Candidatus Thioglobus sp.]MBT3186312.1 alpha/beta fold hydrolase [Candidatus Thioglobus sp.]MBT3432165.1 alpha/beta fold hydrolase [Candidatus Thioglobus sp.]MBT3965708.1 alpha/beta fold hydrolase [Candidatus Thioglobus sp.]MBT6327355.1 alpha/beta fold hydrolase [Candidatus Thioglobus sp.]
MLYSSTTGIGQDLVLLHGWGFNSELFNDLIDRYKNQYRITKIDLPGHGRSDEVNGGLNEWCDEIIKILPNNPTLLGWSLGGLLAINIANKVSISKLILVASTPNFVRTDNWEFGIGANNFEQFSDSLQLNLSKGLKRFVSLQTKDKTQIKHLNQTIDNYPATTQALNQGLNILLKTNLIKTLESLSVEKEVILGKNDTLVPNKIAKWYQQNNIKTQLLNTGHLPFLCDDFLL